VFAPNTRFLRNQLDRAALTLEVGKSPTEVPPAARLPGWHFGPSAIFHLRVRFVVEP
jgi:hypothetical protein